MDFDKNSAKNSIFGIAEYGKKKEVLQSQLTTSVCKSVCKTSKCLAFKPNCGDSRSRTDDPLLAKQVL